MSSQFVEWFGYGASVVVGVSLLMTSVVRLRWINLAGSLLFTAYGLLIHAYPVAVLNFAIALINVWHLSRIHRRSDGLTVVPTDPANPVLAEFLRHHEAGIRKFFPDYRANATQADLALLSLRDAQLAGVILGRRFGTGTLDVTLDYVAPEYRDLKVGRHVFVENPAVLRSLGFTRVAAEAPTPDHRAYLERVGFKPEPAGERGRFVRKL
jgi:GNAT superfamily N-acetyltransferase